MKGSDSSIKLAILNNTLKIESSMAPFKLSVNKNPSYFTVNRSPDLISENKKLKEENWKLRQQLNLKSEELSKIKSKLNHSSYQSLFYKTGEIQSQNKKKYFVMLQDSIRSLRNELKISKQEILDLRKKLYSQHNEKISNSRKNFQSLINFHTDELNLMNNNEGSAEKGGAELRKTLNYMNSEIRILQDEKIELENELGKYKEIVEGWSKKSVKVEGEVITKDEKSKVIKAEGEGEVEEDNKKEKIKKVRVLSQEWDKILKRENLKSNDSVLFRFFNSFLVLCARAKVSNDSIDEFILSSPDEFVSEEFFLQLLRNFEIKMSEIEVKSVFGILRAQNKVEKSEFLSFFKGFLEKMDSDRSSDISSDNSRGISPYSSLKKFQEISVNTTFDNIAIQVRDFGLSKSTFTSSLKSNLPQFVNFSTFLEFLHKFGSFITDPADKTLIVVNFMEGFEYKSREELLQRSLKCFFKYSDGFEANPEYAEEVISRLLEKSSFFLKKFEDFDAYGAETLAWESLYSILTEAKALFSYETEDFKLFCYSLSRNLKKIPYKLLFSISNSTNSSKLPQIKAFIKSRTQLNL